MILSLSTYRGRVSIVLDRYPKQAMRNVIRRAWGPNRSGWWGVHAFGR